MMMNRGYVTSGEAGLVVFLVLTAAFIIALLIGAGKNADDQYIDNMVRESDMCVIRVTAPCGDDICRYKASVPCNELKALIMKERKHDTKLEELFKD